MVRNFKKAQENKAFTNPVWKKLIDKNDFYSFLDIEHVVLNIFFFLSNCIFRTNFTQKFDWGCQRAVK